MTTFATAPTTTPTTPAEARRRAMEAELWYQPREQSKLFEQQSAEFIRVHDAAIHGDPARDIGVGADNSVWIVKSDPEPTAGGYAIYRWDGWDFHRVDGGAVRISVGPDGLPWIIADTGAIFRRVDDTWQQLPGRGTDISVGADGSVWITTATPVHGGYSVARWDGSDWQEIPGGGTDIAVAPDGLPWLINDRGEIHRLLGGRWHKILGGAIDLAFGADGNLWIAGTDAGRHGGNGVRRWNGREWDDIDGAAIRVAVAPNGMLWLLNTRGGVYKRHIMR